MKTNTFTNTTLGLMDKKAIKAHQEAALRLVHSQIEDGEALSVNEICRRTGMSRDSVNRSIERGMRKLQKAFRHTNI